MAAAPSSTHGEAETRERGSGKFRNSSQSKPAYEEGAAPSPPLAWRGSSKPARPHRPAEGRTYPSSRSMQIDTCFLERFRAPCSRSHLFFPGVARSSVGHVLTDASSALNGTGAGPIDAEVRRWETRSAQACGLWPSSSLGVTPRGAAVVNDSRRVPSQTVR